VLLPSSKRKNLASVANSTEQFFWPGARRIRAQKHCAKNEKLTNDQRPKL
jgi:hypothetical protein